MAAELSPYAQHWTLEPGTIYLNHGSFGACPKPVLEVQQALRERMEAQPMRFLYREAEGLLDAARHDLAEFLHCDTQDLVFVPNATAGVNTVLNSLKLRKGDELLVTDHEYNACRNALDAVAQRSGAKVIVSEIPFPLESADTLFEAVFRGATPRTKLLLLDHVTSSTALVMPIARIIWELKRNHIETLVDGAHAPGMLPLDLRALGAAYYTGNCHKWLCAPKGAAFLFVRRDMQEGVRPLVISHGANSTRTDRSRFLLEFDWTGTDDLTPWLCIPEALRFLDGIVPDGLPGLMRHNRQGVLRARKLLCQALQIPEPCPEALLGSMASIPLPDGTGDPPQGPLFLDPIQEDLLRQYRIEVPVFPWPQWPRRLLRVSCQAYNSEAQFSVLAEALPGLVQR